MPCKEDELCYEEATHPGFDTPPKSTETNYSGEDTSSSSHSVVEPYTPQQAIRVLSHGLLYETPKHVVFERRSHPSGITFDSLSPLPGEELKKDGMTDMSNCRVFVTNLRIIIVTKNRHGVCSLPLLDVDSLEAFDETLKIIGKDGRIFSVCAETQEIAMKWYKMVAPMVCGSYPLAEMFAFKFAEACAKQRPLYLKKTPSALQNSLQSLQREFATCGFNEEEWRITKVNEDFKVCASYPQYLIVPKATTDQELMELKRGRFFDRFPTAVWRSKQTGAVLLRSSQPEISFFGTPQEGDTKLFEAIRNVTVAEKKKKIIVIDARSYGAALANRAKGGGFEGGDSYFGAEVSFMNLPNIHSLRYSFHQLRQLLNSSIDSNGYFQALNTSQWFQYLFNLIISSQRCVEALGDGLSVLVHCSDGWDRTTQIVSLVKIISDPFYRTFEGFQRLIMREWVEYGHKFSDRNGMSGTDTNERAPVFMQFLDSVHQLWLKNPDYFQWNQRYLMKLAKHQFSGIFGTFLFNTNMELLQHNEFSMQAGAPCFDKNSMEKSNSATLISVFDYLNHQNPTFLNPVYDARKTCHLVCPKKMWELQIWREVYCCSEIEEVVNNPDNVCYSAFNDMFVYNESSAAEKFPTVSRSQSAASLNSLEQTTNGIHCNGSSGTYNGTNGANPASFVGSSFSTISCISTKQEPYPAWKSYFDVDGLTFQKFNYEDRVVELQRQLLKNDINPRSNSESSTKPNENHSVVVLRHRVESNDSSMFSFDVLDDLDIGTNGRKKRDSTCSSNVVFEFCTQRTASDALIPALNEEELVKCEHCQKDITDESSQTTHPTKSRVNKCSRCTTSQVIPRSSSQVVVS